MRIFSNLKASFDDRSQDGIQPERPGRGVSRFRGLLMICVAACAGLVAGLLLRPLVEDSLGGRLPSPPPLKSLLGGAGGALNDEELSKNPELGARLEGVLTSLQSQRATLESELKRCGTSCQLLLSEGFTQDSAQVRDINGQVEAILRQLEEVRTRIEETNTMLIRYRNAAALAAPAQEVPEVPEELATALDRLEIEQNIQPDDPGDIAWEYKP